MPTTKRLESRRMFDIQESTSSPEAVNVVSILSVSSKVTLKVDSDSSSISVAISHASDCWVHRDPTLKSK
ncbi:hypothetical protein IEQ34_001506 [Dendrobium chrysotoxum]|uniref:Uncharacterized protein n=1 Tax=Dendrobium chrysotoxum TaxID=161865 RepID=A0AAV7HPE6_DENCH|nr:hypothetical protein IEQ34_001506 [Dendrobium chrysotoxum]